MNNILLLCILCAVASVSMVLAICITISVLTIVNDIFSMIKKFIGGIIGELLAEIEEVDQAEAEEERQRIKIRHMKGKKYGE